MNEYVHNNTVSKYIWHTKSQGFTMAHIILCALGS